MAVFGKIQGCFPHMDVTPKWEVWLDGLGRAWGCHILGEIVSA